MGGGATRADVTLTSAYRFGTARSNLDRPIEIGRPRTDRCGAAARLTGERRRRLGDDGLRRSDGSPATALTATGAARRRGPPRGVGSSSPCSGWRQCKLRVAVATVAGGGGFSSSETSSISVARVVDFCGESEARVGGLNRRPKLARGASESGWIRGKLHRPDELVMNWDSSSF